MPSDTIASLIARIRGGEGSEPVLLRRLDAAFGKHEDAVRAFCTRELRGVPGEQIEEVVQDVLLVAWQRFADFRGESTWRTWLFGIAARTCANYRRKSRDVLTEDGWLDGTDDSASALGELEQEERSELMRAAAATVLDARDQEIVYLRYGLDEGLAEIAAQVGVDDPDDIRVVLQRARRRIAKEVRRRLEAMGHGTSFLRGSGA